METITRLFPTLALVCLLPLFGAPASLAVYPDRPPVSVSGLADSAPTTAETSTASEQVEGAFISEAGDGDETLVLRITVSDEFAEERLNAGNSGQDWESEMSHPLEDILSITNGSPKGHSGLAPQTESIGLSLGSQSTDAGVKGAPCLDLPSSHPGNDRIWTFICRNQTNGRAAISKPAARPLVAKPGQMVKLSSRPEMIAFNDVRRGEDSSKTIWLSMDYVGRFQIDKVVTDKPCLKAMARSSRNGYFVTLTLRSKDLAIGEFRGKVTFTTKQPQSLKLDVPITARIVGDIEVFPESLFFGMSKKGTGPSRKVTISTDSGRPFKILRIDNPMSCLSVRVSPKVAGKSYVLSGTIVKETPAGYINNAIVVHTDNRRQPKIRIPVSALIQE